MPLWTDDEEGRIEPECTALEVQLSSRRIALIKMLKV